MPLGDAVGEFSKSGAGKSSKLPLGKFNFLTKKPEKLFSSNNWRCFLGFFCLVGFLVRILITTPIFTVYRGHSWR